MKHTNIRVESRNNNRKLWVGSDCPQWLINVREDGKFRVYDEAFGVELVYDQVRPYKEAKSA